MDRCDAERLLSQPIGMMYVGQIRWAGIYVLLALMLVIGAFCFHQFDVAISFLQILLALVATVHAYRLALSYPADKPRPIYSRWYGLVGSTNCPACANTTTLYYVLAIRLLRGRKDVFARAPLAVIKAISSAGTASIFALRPTSSALCRMLKSRPMQISLNGEPRQLPGAFSVAALVESLGYTGKRIAVERNGEIVPRGRHADILLSEGDRIEIVVAVGGG